MKIKCYFSIDALFPQIQITGNVDVARSLSRFCLIFLKRKSFVILVNS